MPGWLILEQVLLNWRKNEEKLFDLEASSLKLKEKSQRVNNTHFIFYEFHDEYRKLSTKEQN